MLLVFLIMISSIAVYANTNIINTININNTSIKCNLDDSMLNKLSLEDINIMNYSYDLNILNSINNAILNRAKLIKMKINEKILTKLSVDNINTVCDIIDKENLTKEQAKNLVTSLANNTNFGKFNGKPDAIVDFDGDQYNFENINDITAYSNVSIPEQVRNTEATGVHYIVRSKNGYYKATGWFTFPDVEYHYSSLLKNKQINGRDVPYGFFGIFTSEDGMGFDLGAVCKEDGTWGFCAYGYYKDSSKTARKYYKDLCNGKNKVLVSKSKTPTVYFIAKAIKGTYDTVELTVIDAGTWKTLGVISVCSNEESIDPITWEGGQPPAYSNIFKTGYSNCRMHREVSLAHNKQLNRPLTGTKILNAKWEKVYIYSPSTTSLWKPEHTLNATRYSQTSRYCNTVHPTVDSTKRWYEDITSIIYE